MRNSWESNSQGAERLCSQPAPGPGTGTSLCRVGRGPGSERWTLIHLCLCVWTFCWSSVCTWPCPFLSTGLKRKTDKQEMRAVERLCPLCRKHGAALSRPGPRARRPPRFLSASPWNRSHRRWDAGSRAHEALESELAFQRHAGKAVRPSEGGSSALPRALQRGFG